MSAVSSGDMVNYQGLHRQDVLAVARLAPEVREHLAAASGRRGAGEYLLCPRGEKPLRIPWEPAETTEDDGPPA